MSELDADSDGFLEPDVISFRFDANYFSWLDLTVCVISNIYLSFIGDGGLYTRSNT